MHGLGRVIRLSVRPLEHVARSCSLTPCRKSRIGAVISSQNSAPVGSDIDPSSIRKAAVWGPSSLPHLLAPRPVERPQRRDLPGRRGLTRQSGPGVDVGEAQWPVGRAAGVQVEEPFPQMRGLGRRRRHLKMFGPTAGAAGKGLQVVAQARAVRRPPGQAEAGAGVGDQAVRQPVPEAMMKFTRSAANPPTWASSQGRSR